MKTSRKKNIAWLLMLMLPLLAGRGLAAESGNTDWFKDARHGVFMHLLPGNARDLARVDQFDAAALAGQLAEAGAGYFVLTLGQNSGYFNAPNAAYDKITGYAPGERCARRDLPLDLYRALRPKGIRLMLYLPCQAPNRDARSQQAFGLPQGARDQPLDLAFAKKWAVVIQEWSDRYGDKVAGWWFDGGYAHVKFNDEIARIYAAAAKHGNPKAIVTFNPGVRVIRHTQAEDYTAGELNEPFGAVPASRWLEGSQWHALTFLGSAWSRRDTRYPAEKWVGWTRAVIAHEGVFTLDAGPNWDPQSGPIGALAEVQMSQLRAIKAGLDQVPDTPGSALLAVPAHVKAAPGTGDVPGPLPLRKMVTTATAPPAAPVPGLTLHVAPNGDDAAAGTAEKPFASLERARDAIRSIRQKPGWPRGGLPKGGVTVILHGGEYKVSKTFNLTAEDSGEPESPLCYCAAPGERVSFRGGVRLSGWKPLNDAALYPLLPRQSLGKVWVLDLKGAGVANPLPLKLGGFGSGNGFVTHPTHELFFNGQAMQLARGPNAGFLRIADVAVKDGTKDYDRQGSKTGVFTYQGDLPGKWAAEPDLLLYGYWYWDWADSYERVAAIDPAKRVITLARPWHSYGFRIGAPFYAYNALSELDAPGEWYLDRTKGRLLFYPPADLKGATVELSTFPGVMVDLNNASYVRFEGLTWELGSADAIHLQGGSDCLFAGCTVRQFAGSAIELQGGSHHGVVSCDIHSMGRGGVSVTGGNRRTLTPGGHLIENCDIYDLSRIDHTYTPALIIDGVGDRVRHNRLHDIPSSAIRLGGNDHTVEYNEIYSVVTESDDQGGVDMWGNPTYRGNVLRYNYWHHIGSWRATDAQPACGQCAIRLDDAICGTWIHGNIFERCSAGKTGFGGVQIHGGKDNIVEGNLFVDCMAMVSCSPWDATRWQQFVKSALDNRAIDRVLYLQKYPELATLLENNNLNHIRNNRALRCQELYRRAPKNLDAANNINLPEAELTLAPGDPILSHPGYERIPIDEMGLYADAWRTMK